MFTHSHINNDTKLHKNIILARKGSCFVINKYFIFKNLYIRFNLIKFYSIFLKVVALKLLAEEFCQRLWTWMITNCINTGGFGGR